MDDDGGDDEGVVKMMVMVLLVRRILISFLLTWLLSGFGTRPTTLVPWAGVPVPAVLVVTQPEPDVKPSHI